MSADYVRHRTERAGWVAYALGTVSGLLLALTGSTGPARCHEDEVALWPMLDGEYVSYENTHCVPLDDL